MVKMKKTTLLFQPNTLHNLNEYFDVGWKLNPWLHTTGRLWSVQTEQHPLEFVANLVMFEEGDDPTDPEWIAYHSPVVNVPIPKIKLKEEPGEQIITTAIVPHDAIEQEKYIANGYRITNTFSKNVIMTKHGDINEHLLNEIAELKLALFKVTEERDLLEEGLNKAHATCESCVGNTENAIPNAIDSVDETFKQLEVLRNLPINDIEENLGNLGQEEGGSPNG